MKSFIPFVLIALAGSMAQAQSFTVKKMKGKQAIIQMTSGTFSEGQSVSVGGGESSSSHSGGSGSGPRNNYLGFAFDMTSVKTTTTTAPITSKTVTDMSLNVLYGWNKGAMEYGVGGTFASSSGGAANATAFGLIGNFDYNFTENRPGVDGIFLVGILGSYVMNNPGSATTISVFPSVGYKWFILGTPTCLRFDAGMKMTQVSASGVSATDTQPHITGGLYTYF